MLKETEFTKGIIFEENPFDSEQPDTVQFFDLNGNEVISHEAE